MILTMKIESLSEHPDRAGRYRVAFSNGTVMRLYPQTVEMFQLYTGRELTNAELFQVRQAAGSVSAKMRAARIVSAAAVSASELESRLKQKGESPEDAKAAVEWMQEHSFVDDLTTAKELVRRGVNKGYGINRLRQILYEKKIPRELWDQALGELPEPDEAIIAFLNRRLGQEADSKEQKKAIDALLRRGHTWQDIRRCLNQRGADMEYEPEE